MWSVIALEQVKRCTNEKTTPIFKHHYKLYAITQFYIKNYMGINLPWKKRTKITEPSSFLQHTWTTVLSSFLLPRLFHVHKLFINEVMSTFLKLKIPNLDLCHLRFQKLFEYSHCVGCLFIFHGLDLENVIRCILWRLWNQIALVLRISRGSGVWN